MSRKKKTETTQDLKITTKAKPKKVVDEVIEVTEKDIAIVSEEVTKNSPVSNIGEFSEKEETKSKKKWYSDCGTSWDCERIVLEVNGKEYTKTYPMKINISKEKIGKLTKYKNPDENCSGWGKIISYEETDTDLVFTLIPID